MKRLATMVAVTMSVQSAFGAYGSGESKSGAAFLRINPSVRGEALGGLNPVSAFGTAGVSVNPANLAVVEGGELTSAFATMMGDSQYGHVGVGMKGFGGAVGGSVTFLRSGQLQGRDSSGNPTADFVAQDLAAGLTAATSLGEDFRAGVTAKAIKEEIGSYKSKMAFAADAGIGFETGNIGWGIAALNVGSKIDFNGFKEPLPTTYSLGASVPLGGGMTALIGGSQTLGETSANMGLEYNLKPVSFRAGYRSGSGSSLAKSGQKSSEQALGGLTGGFGIGFKSLRIEYAISQTAVEWGMSQRASVTWKWGGEQSEEPVRDSRPRRAKKTVYQPKPTYRAPQSETGVTTGSRRAYDTAPIRKKAKKRWAY